MTNNIPSAQDIIKPDPATTRKLADRQHTESLTSDLQPGPSADYWSYTTPDEQFVFQHGMFRN